MNFQGKSAIVTGGAQGIGRAIAKELANGGAQVLVCDLQAEKVEATAAEIRDGGSSAIEVTADVTDPGQVEAMVKQAVETFG